MGGKKTEVKSFTRNVDLREKNGGKKTKVKLFSRNVDLWEKANHGQDLCVRSQNASLALENANVRLDFQCLQAKDFVTSTTDYFLC